MNNFDMYSILFWEDKVFIDGHSYPLGQNATDALNIEAGTVEELRRTAEEFDAAALALVEKKDRDQASAVQEKLNAFLDILLALPPYRDLHIDKKLTYDLFPTLVKDEAKWQEAMTEGTNGNTYLTEFLQKVRSLPENLQRFREQVTLMLLFYYEDLPKRNAYEYGAAYSSYYLDMLVGGEFLFPDTIFSQAITAEVDFVPMFHPDDPQKIMIAEKTQFDSMHAFLYTDFYRVMMRGHIPRRCHNCGRFFLQLNGYNAMYCNRIAPGETTRTCRKVGAHRKEQGKSELPEHPERGEYDTVYGRLKMQKRRKKISTAEWNDLVAQALEIKAMSERGEIDDATMREMFDRIGRE